MYTILLVEDDLQIQNAIANFLNRENFNVIKANTGTEGIQLFNDENIDLILLDMMLPEKSGEEVLREIRWTSDIPIIIISALNDELIQLDAFEQQVDDYVVKPFSMNILIYKIKALLRRTYKKINSNIYFKDLEIHVDNYYVSFKGEEISLTAKEFEMLQLLLTNKGKVFTREEILTILWGYDYFGDTRNIDVHIKNLRKKIPMDFITTIKGIGYRIDKEKI